MRKTAIFLASLVLSASALAQSLPVVSGTVTKIDAGQGKMYLEREYS